ncbi:MAG: hypothetical protein JSV49_12595 [Thermoplasmata archaeon]|nr:MAG: hypothetical protein JSV49_12595 [Thermoplasmata archaeon]
MSYKPPVENPGSKLFVYLYKPTTAFSFPIEMLAQFIQDTLKDKLVNNEVEIREEFLQNYVVSEEDLTPRKHAAEIMARCRIEDIKVEQLPYDKDEKVQIFYTAMELNLLEGIPPDRCRDYLYHGPRLMENFRNFIPESERTLEHLHIIFTDRLFCSWNFSDARYHARAIFLGFPHLISMPGLVEAPARPREYYIKRHLYASSGLPVDELEAEFAGQYLIYKDARTVEALKGYILQSLFYTLFKDPFCTDPDCRLFNSHWQSELLRSQLESGKLCKNHSEIIKQYVDGK